LIPVHPTETAGTGQQQKQSFYLKKSDIPDNIVECAQCGFLVDLRQHPSGDSYGAVGNPTIKTDNVGAPFWQDTTVKVPSYTETYGDPQPTAGCPLCGTLNPQAKGRGQSGFDKTVKSILGL
jgi:ssDNA-binding Zn-finger/Zn-ribbon topoisomerase 1